MRWQGAHGTGMLALCGNVGTSWRLCSRAPNHDFDGTARSCSWNFEGLDRLLKRKAMCYQRFEVHSTWRNHCQGSRIPRYNPTRFQNIMQPTKLIIHSSSTIYTVKVTKPLLVISRHSICIANTTVTNNNGFQMLPEQRKRKREGLKVM